MSECQNIMVCVFSGLDEQVDGYYGLCQSTLVSLWVLQPCVWICHSAIRNFINQVGIPTLKSWLHLFNICLIHSWSDANIRFSLSFGNHLQQHKCSFSFYGRLKYITSKEIATVVILMFIYRLWLPKNLVCFESISMCMWGKNSDKRNAKRNCSVNQ